LRLALAESFVFFGFRGPIIGAAFFAYYIYQGNGGTMKKLTGPKHLAFGGVALAATAIGALAVGAFAIGALAIGRLAIRRIVADGAEFKSVKIEELTVNRLRVSDSLELPSGSVDPQIS
jgi:hypothetical protein